MMTISKLIENAVPELRGKLNLHRDYSKDALKKIQFGEVPGFTIVGDVPDHHNSTAVIRHDVTGRMFTMEYSSGCGSFDWYCSIGHEVAPDSDALLDELRMLESRVKAIADRIRTPLSEAGNR